MKGWKDAALVEGFVSMMLKAGEHPQIPAVISDPLLRWKARLVRSEA